MKRFWIIAILTLVLAVSAGVWVAGVQAADDQFVCGKTYTLFFNEVTYLIKFVNSAPELPCTSGTVTLSWQDKREFSEFSINSKYIITAPDFGKFCVDGQTLYFLDSATLVMTEY